NILPGEPIALLQERFAPVYFMHRFALNSLSKTIGGMEYSNATRGDGQQETRPIAGSRQRAALHQLLSALQPAELAIPDTVITLLGPRPSGFRGSVELFRSRSEPAFDDLGAARTLAQMIVDGVLQTQRADRLVQFAARDRDALTLGETIDSLVAVTWQSRSADGPKLAALRRVARRAVVDRVMALAADTDADPEARAIADLKLSRLRQTAGRRATDTSPAGGGDGERASWMAISGDIGRWLDRHELPQPSKALVAPPGDPFGMDP
ncbi:MAG: zinc-dependent metalloprotease, partial [Gemmatimonadota bacterium]|nr:zinc-dependent metalloprotease [Gemmatimonadota bacterium]